MMLTDSWLQRPGILLIHLHRPADTVDPMSADAITPGWYLAEWYQGGPVTVSSAEAADRLTRAAANNPESVTLLTTLSVPGDQTVFAVFRATHDAAVEHTCLRAGWPVNRISTMLRPWPVAE